MADITQILAAIEGGDPHAAAELLPLVYDELRKLARARMAEENPGHTLQATALVHEAYLRLVGPADEPRWASRGHFFAAAAQAMRRILVESARRKGTLKRGAEGERVAFDPEQFAAPERPEDLLALDEALDQLALDEPRVAELVKLRYFAGLTIPETADVLGVSPRTADAWWAFARSWLLAKLRGEAL
jgi:RNA polymerase sigma factor (TIGR02999 family)